MAERLSTGFADALNITGSVREIMTDFVIHIRSGSQPATADAVETGSLLMIITQDGGDFTSGSATNGLEFDATSGGVLSKKASEVWKGTGLAAAGTGTPATWFRAYANTVVTGASTTAVRFDGAIGTSASYEMQMTPSTTIVEGVETTVNTFNYTTTKQ